MKTDFTGLGNPVFIFATANTIKGSEHVSDQLLVRESFCLGQT